MIRKVPLVLAIMLLASASKEDETRKDLEKIQGDWAEVSYVVDGVKVPDDEAQALFRSIKDDKYTIFQFKKVIGKGTFKLDATKKPRTIDAETTVGGRKLTLLGIYELDGDTLKICFAPPGKPRPTNFTSKKGSEHRLSVWEREKK
ncbi:MAG TPA: TIGR03067 domain-containing protein [Gemmataceae bacterium]|nr:TIGR03067 domain-containing protein [Gemmataceae bacterium]